MQRVRGEVDVETPPLLGFPDQPPPSYISQMPTLELSGVTIVGAGSFNPAIVHPLWLAEKGLIAADAAEHAMQQGGARPMIVSAQLASFVADWLSVQVTQEHAVLATVDQGREVDLRDLARGIFDLLPETPIDALGINSDSHFRTADESAWHAFGDRFLPKAFWEPLFEPKAWKPRSDGKLVGMRGMTVEVSRGDPRTPGHVRIELAPSLRTTPNGIYVGINAHFQLATDGRRAKASDAARVLTEQWEATRALESTLVGKLAEAV